jgi:hypothetical protein
MLHVRHSTAGDPVWGSLDVTCDKREALLLTFARRNCDSGVMSMADETLFCLRFNYSTMAFG